MAKLAMNIQGVNFNLEASREYVSRKVAKIIDFIPKQFREIAHANVRIERDGKWFTALVKVQLPGRILFVREKAASVQSAIDNAERKLRGQIQRYKTARLLNLRNAATI